MIESNNKSSPSNILSIKTVKYWSWMALKTQGWWNCTKTHMSGNLSGAHVLEQREQKSHILWHTDPSSSGIGYL